MDGSQIHRDAEHSHKESCAGKGGAPKTSHGDAHAHHGSGGALATSAQATLHCLTGCVIGEVTGLAIGVTLGIGVWPTIILATALAYVSGFALGVVPVMRRMNLSFLAALKLIWIGEAVSIGVMEIAMNAADYFMGGMTAGSVFAPAFWLGIGAAIPAGFLAAWPVNYWLVARGMKKCH